MATVTHRLRAQGIAAKNSQKTRAGESTSIVVNCNGKHTPNKTGEITLSSDDSALNARFERAVPLFSSLACTVADTQRPLNRGFIDSLANLIPLSEEPLYAAFLARSFRALAKLTPKLDLTALGEALGEDTDFEVLLRALAEPNALAVLSEGSLAEMRLRDLEFRKTIQEAEGGVLSVEEVARLLGISRQAVDKRRQKGRILALPVGDHRYVYPAWQFSQTGMLDGFEQVLAELSLPDPWTQAAFFLGENALLDGQRPLDELRRGNVESTCRAAWAMGEQGAA
jgi:hypothetical protein